MDCLSDLPHEVFLDTSIHLANLKGRDISRRVHETLRKFRWRGTASYAKVEYGNNILSRVCYYRRMLRKLGSLERLRYHIDNVLIPKFKLHGKHRTWFSNLLSKCLNPVDDREATERAERELGHLWRLGTAVVDALCDCVHDEIKCICADQSNATQWKKPDGRCKRTEPGCRLPQFFVDNRQHFCQIRDTIRQLPQERLTEELRRFADTIDEACADPRVLKDHRVCSGFADAIIAVQSLRYRSFFTQNVKESDVLCEVLAQLLLYLHQSPEDEVELRDYRSATPLLPRPSARSEGAPEVSTNAPKIKSQRTRDNDMP